MRKTMLKNVKADQPFRLWSDEGQFYFKGPYSRTLKKYPIFPVVSCLDSTATYFRGNFIVYVQE